MLGKAEIVPSGDARVDHESSLWAPPYYDVPSGLLQIKLDKPNQVLSEKLPLDSAIDSVDPGPPSFGPLPAIEKPEGLDLVDESPGLHSEA